MYITYDEYKMYGGSTLDEPTFQQLEFEARTVIDYWTFNRLQKETEYPEAVKRCMYKLISLLDNKRKSLITDTVSEDGGITAGISSVSNDGVSTSYNTLSAKDMIDTVQKEMGNVIRTYLTNVRDSLGRKVLYRGVYPNE